MKLNEQLFDLINIPKGKEQFNKYLTNELEQCPFINKQEIISIKYKWVMKNTLQIKVKYVNKQEIICYMYILDSVYIKVRDDKNDSIYYQLDLNPSQLMRKAKLEKLFTE